MASLQFFDYPGFGERTRKAIHASQAVRVDNHIYIAGQGGWYRDTEKYPDTIAAHYDQVFDNVQHTLEQAGGKGWEEVYDMTVYMLEMSPEDKEALVRNIRKWCPNHEPVLTAIGVKSLAFPEMRVEIKVSARVGA